MERTRTSSDRTKSIGYKYGYTNPFGYTDAQLYHNGTLTNQELYNYNADGQVTQRNSLAGFIHSNLKLQYDYAGRLRSVGTGVQDNNYFYTGYGYTIERLTKVQTNGQQSYSGADKDNATYEYCPDGKIKKITYPKLNDNSYLTTEYTYNPLGRMTSMINKKSSKVLSQFTYTHDANGNITSVNDGQITKNYVYDKLDQLIESQYPNGNTMRYTYDYEGNRIGEVGGSFDLDLDINYSYDLENRLKTVTNKTSTTSMSYYVNGMRAKKESSSGYTNYIYNLSDKLVAEAENSSTVTSNYVWGPDRVLVKKDVGGGEYYYLYNGHGDVVQMVDRNGTIVNNYEYDEWGNIRISNETVSNPFKYAGEVYDEETGLYYLRARYYDPTMGRFINADTYEGQVNNSLTLNLYTYCHNNPLLYSDPSGHKIQRNQWDNLAFGFYTRGFEIADSLNFMSANPFDAINTSLAMWDFIGAIASGDIGPKDLKAMGINAIAGDLKYVIDNWNIVTDNKKYSNAAISKFGSHLAGAGEELVNAGLLVYGAGKGASSILKGTGKTGADNIANMPKLKAKLTYEEASSVFTKTGTLRSEVIKNSNQIMDGSKLNKPNVIKALTRDGSSINDWAKMSTGTFRCPGGNFQVHFYKNLKTGKISTYEMKVKFNK